MKILALIPARGGSKRIPGKNIKPLGGIPLIGWTIRAAQQSGVCDEIQVSTDDEAIADVARAYGAAVPGLRPMHLASDTAGSVDVALHAPDIYESEHGNLDGLLLLQPTSPFRSAETIRKAIQFFREGDPRRPVVSVSPASCHPAWSFRITDSGMEPFLGWDSIFRRSQELDEAWTLNGAIYIISPEQLRMTGRFLTHDTRPFLIDSVREALDIDTPEDWMHAEASL